MAGSRAARALRLFRRHRQQLWLAPLPEPSRQSMAWHTEAAQPKATTVVGSLQRSSARQPSAAAPARSHLARASDLKREYSSEEPDAGKLQVRICGGGGGRPPPLPDQRRRFLTRLAFGVGWPRILDPTATSFRVLLAPRAEELKRPRLVN